MLSNHFQILNEYHVMMSIKSLETWNIFIRFFLLINLPSFPDSHLKYLLFQISRDIGDLGSLHLRECRANLSKNKNLFFVSFCFFLGWTCLSSICFSKNCPPSCRWETLCLSVYVHTHSTFVMVLGIPSDCMREAFTFCPYCQI